MAQLEGMTKALLEELISEDEGGSAFCKADETGIELSGQRFVPDETKGYFKFRFSNAFPVFNAYGQGIHPNVVSISHQSLLHQNANYEHRLVAYDKEKNAYDKILGTVVAVHFPRAPMSGWRVETERAKAPGIEAVASFTKLAQGMQTVLGRHQTGRHRFTVSMEVQYRYKDCAFAVALNAKQTPKHETPDDMVKAGYEYIPWTKAEDDLLGTFSVEKNRITKEWKGRKVIQLMGGLDKAVHYSGVGIVQYGAEPEAVILQMAASQTGDIAAQAMQPLKAFIEKVRAQGK